MICVNLSLVIMSVFTKFEQVVHKVPLVLSLLTGKHRGSLVNFHSMSKSIMEFDHVVGMYFIATFIVLYGCFQFPSRNPLH